MKPMRKVFGDFYSPEHLLSYNRPWMISVGSRSIGKSTGWTIWCIADYLRNGKRFIYVRRTDDETNKTAKTACDSAFLILRDAGYDIYEVTAERGFFWLKRTPDQEKPEEIGMYFSLSQAYKYKSANFGVNNYSWIIYDEFINIDKTKYLGTKENITYEYDRCLELYQTVDRGIGKPYRNETRFIFIANLATYYNPIFIGLGIDEYIRTDSKTIAPKGKLWVLEQTKAVKATEEMKQSFSYQLSNSKNQDYAYENIAFDAKMNFVEKINKPMRGLFNIKWNEKIIGMYYVPGMNVIYASNKITQKRSIALTENAQNKIDYTLATRPADNVAMMQLKKFYYNGLVICESNKIRYIIANYFMLTP